MAVAYLSVEHAAAVTYLRAVAPTATATKTKETIMRSIKSGVWKTVLGSLMTVVALSACLGLGATGCGTEDDAAAPSTVQRFDRDLAMGANGQDVRALHEYLTSFGYFPNDKLAREYPSWRPLVAQPPADQSVFDQHTSDAVARLQQNTGLKVTGNVDAETRAVLEQPRCGVPEGIPALDPSDKFSRMSSWLGRQNLTWKLIEAGIPSNIGLTNATIAAQNAFNTWQAQSSLSFSQISGAAGSPNANISVQWADLGAGNVLGSTPPGGQQVQLNTRQVWNIGAANDVQSVMLHEIGHALGIHHSAFGEAVMFPSGGPPKQFTSVDDNVAISSFYDSFSKLPGAANDIGAGADGSVWIISKTPINSEFRIARFNGTSWDFTAELSGGVRIAVQPDGRPWVVQSNGLIWRRQVAAPGVAAGWDNIPGSAKDIGIGADGSVWVIGSGTGDQQVFRFNGSGWDGSNGFATRVTVGTTGIPWVMTNDGSVWRRNTPSAAGGGWNLLPGRIGDIGVSQTGSSGQAGYAWSVATASNGQVSLALFDEQPGSGSGGSVVPACNNWITANQFTPLGTSGPAASVAAGLNGKPFVVTQVGDIFTSIK
jgi:hypothetical protein